MKIGTLICAYNEEKHIKKVANQCLKILKDTIVVNDGSKDKTLKELEKTKATIITYKENKGKGHALKTGFKYAAKNKFDYLILLDGDGQHDPKEISKFIKEIKRSQPDLIIGYRRKSKSKMPKRRKFANFTSSALISLKGKQWIKDSQSGFRAIKISSLKNLQLKKDKYDLETEIILKMMKQKAKISQIPIKTIYGDETSTVHPIKDTARFLRSLKTK